MNVWKFDSDVNKTDIKALLISIFAYVFCLGLIICAEHTTTPWVLDACNALILVLTAIAAVCFCFVVKNPAVAFACESGEIEGTEETLRGKDGVQ
jgi:hypothetical protein